MRRTTVIEEKKKLAYAFPVASNEELSGHFFKFNDDHEKRRCRELRKIDREREESVQWPLSLAGVTIIYYNSRYHLSLEITIVSRYIGIFP